MAGKKKGYKCKRVKPIKRATLKQMSCHDLWARMACFGAGHKAQTKEQFGEMIPIIPCFPGDVVGTDCTTLGQSLTDLMDVLSNRYCPPIDAQELKVAFTKLLPHRRFIVKGNQVLLPKSITQAELGAIQSEMDGLTGEAYAIRHNERLQTWHISPKRRSEVMV
jgi:hypothetical protein